MTTIDTSSTDQAIEQLAHKIEQLGFSVPITVLLEACKPLHSLADHALTLLPNSISFEHPWVAVLRDRILTEKLIARLEHPEICKQQMSVPSDGAS